MCRVNTINLFESLPKETSPSHLPTESTTTAKTMEKIKWTMKTGKGARQEGQEKEQDREGRKGGFMNSSEDNEKMNWWIRLWRVNVHFVSSWRWWTHLRASTCNWKSYNSPNNSISTVSCQKALSDILTFLPETQKHDYRYLSFLSSFAKIVNNSTPDYQCTKLQSF